MDTIKFLEQLADTVHHCPFTTKVLAEQMNDSDVLKTQSDDVLLYANSNFVFAT